MYTSVLVIVFYLLQEGNVVLHNLCLFLLYLDLIIVTGFFVSFVFLIHLSESNAQLTLKHLDNFTYRHAFKKLQSRPVMLVPIFMMFQYFSKGSRYLNNNVIIHFDSILLLRMCYGAFRKDFAF